MKYIDDFLNSVTMYRLVLYVLSFFLAVAIVLSFLKLLPFDPINLVVSTAVLITVCWFSNKVFSKIFNAPANLESNYITAFILTLIITPPNNLHDFLVLGFVGILSQASKYVLAINKKHIFNPAALAAFFAAVVLKNPASWWIGNQYMLIPVLFGGLLIVRKVRRISLVLTFLIVYAFFAGPQIVQTILESPIFFFAFIMLTEPQTTPPAKILQIVYGVLVGIGTFYQTPEIALLLGNIFSYVVSPKEKLFLKLKEKIQIAPETYDFIFERSSKFVYLPGQYMEWTLGLSNPDTRGNRRYFTLAASPTEENLRIGVKFYPNGSSFKKALLDLPKNGQIVASSLSGEFILPKNLNQKLCFIAGGIGITPFRSMVKYLLDSNEKRDIILFYSGKTQQDFVYKDIFEKANQLGVQTVYVATDKMGYIDEKMIREKVPDFKDRIFYISGPHSLVDAFEKTLKEMGVKNIKVDFFPGYA